MLFKARDHLRMADFITEKKKNETPHIAISKPYCYKKKDRKVEYHVKSRKLEEN